MAGILLFFFYNMYMYNVIQFCVRVHLHVPEGKEFC